MLIKQKFSGREEAEKNPASIYFAFASIIFLSAGVFTGCAGRHHASEDELLISSAEKYAAIEDYRARFSRMTDIGGVKTEVEGEIVYKNPDNMKMNTTDIKGGRGTFCQVVVWDGENIWRENRGSERRVHGVSSYKVSQVKPLLESDFLGLGKLDFSPNISFSPGQLENLLEYYTFTVQGAKELRGTKVDIVAGDLKRRSIIQRLKEASTLFPEKVKFYMGAEDGFHYRKEYFDGEGNLIFFEEFEDVVFDSGLSEEIFSYQVPEGAEVEFVDLSETEICRVCPIDESLPRAADFTLPDLEGNMHSLSDFHGRLTVLLVNEPGYQDVLGAMQVIHEMFGDRKVKVIVAFMSKDIGRLSHLYNIKKYDFLTLYTPEGHPTSLKEDYEIRYAKTIFYIDQEGRIRNSYAGPMPAARLRREVIDAGTRSGFFERNIRSEVPRLTEEVDLLSAAEMDRWFRRPGDAEKKLDKILEINPENLYALSMKSGIVSQQNRFEEAVEIFEEMSRISPEWDYPHNRIAFLCRNTLWREQETFRGKNVFDFGIEECLKALGKNPESLYTHYQLGILYWSRMKDDEAIEAFKWPETRGISMRSSAHRRIANIYHRRRDYTKAREHYQKSLELNNLCKWSWVELAKVWEEKGNIEKAVKCYREIIRLYPYDTDSYLIEAREGLKRLEDRE